MPQPSVDQRVGIGARVQCITRAVDYGPEIVHEEHILAGTQPPAVQGAEILDEHRDLHGARRMEKGVLVYIESCRPVHLPESDSDRGTLHRRYTLQNESTERYRLLGH